MNPDTTTPDFATRRAAVVKKFNDRFTFSIQEGSGRWDIKCDNHTLELMRDYAVLRCGPHHEIAKELAQLLEVVQ